MTGHRKKKLQGRREVSVSSRLAWCREFQDSQNCYTEKPCLEKRNLLYSSKYYGGKPKPVGEVSAVTQKIKGTYYNHKELKQAKTLYFQLFKTRDSFTMH